MKNSNFGLKGRFKSFQYAGKGMFYFFKTETNGKIHLGASIVAVVMGFWLQISQQEWLWISSAIAFVLVLEILNSAIESMLDLIYPDFNTQVGHIKDMCAGAVLIAAMYAAIVGFAVFLPKLATFF